ncbi:hypothetical protein [Paenibacillus sacheonensis]|uniref:Lipoprotein n=1 Tax=Paenibacillus sacheonensis TaxID=742054 RepID=A0A7X4YMY0_9BACL|nr:hypothetical protein [Paenibacillus sacheonensis]MBM7563093.1 hypothetical protein [Paenibacillus sacheonensis]NBC68339.1 hypothetical protein [Paenibacillus sacheonensis]
MNKRVLYFLCVVIACLMAAGCKKQLPDEPVRPTIKWGKQAVTYLDGQSCWYGTNEEEGICDDPQSPAAFQQSINAQAIVAETGGIIRITFPIKPDVFTLTLARTDRSEEQVGEPNQSRFRLPLKPGYYSYRLSAVWDKKNTASYHFGIHIKE